VYGQQPIAAGASQGLTRMKTAERYWQLTATLVVMLACVPSLPQAAPGTYSSNFDLTENPISEGGAWVQGGRSTGLDWTNVRTSGGIAFSTQTGSGGYDDSIALLGGFGADQRISAVVHLATGAKASATSSHEVELILRGSYTAHAQHLYECNLGYADSSGGFYAQIMRMDGAIGSFAEIDSQVSQLPTIRDGDVFTAEIIGNRINTYVNGVKILTAADSTYANGQPGIGFFWRGTQNVNDFAFTSITATDVSSTVRPLPPGNVRAQ
jgi:hypothetical protein